MAVAWGAGEARETPVWFGPEERPLFGWLHSPPNGLVRGGVVLCAPVAYEDYRSYPVLKALADSLANSGLVALRLSYDGTGDSSGHFDDAERTRAWTESVAAACRLLRDGGVSSVALIGMRIGAIVATHAAQAEEDLAAMVLWDPCLTGKEFLRHQAMVLAGLSAEFPGDPDGVEATYYFFPEAMAGEVRAMELAPLSPDVPTLALLRSDGVISGQLQRRLVAGGADVVETDDLAQFLGEYGPIVPPKEVIKSVVAWLDERFAAPPVNFVVPERDRTVVEGHVTGSRVVEFPRRLGPHGLFGMVTEPENGARGPCIVLFNMGVDYHVGPGRQWVELARRWAQAGLRSVRVDFGGVGESPLRPGQAPERIMEYPAEWIDDACDMVTAIKDEGCERVILVGVCSGGTIAFEAAQRVGVEAVVAVNPMLDRRRAPERPQTDGRRPSRTAARLAEFGREHHRIADRLWKAYVEVGVRQAPMGVVNEVIEKGSDVWLAVGDRDHEALMRTAYWRNVGLPRLRKQGKLSINRIPILEHGLGLSPGRVLAMEMVSSQILSRRTIDEDGPASLF